MPDQASAAPSAPPLSNGDAANLKTTAPQRDNSAQIGLPLTGQSRKKAGQTLAKRAINPRLLKERSKYKVLCIVQN
ncbi:hypothetical protein FMN50_08680 [Rhodobacterales bacterium]|nr:hypothetical protein FMN50_08680 [Rhodobacterales bacterium]